MPPREEWSLDTRRLGRRVLVYDRLDSTNNLAMQLADDPGNDGLVILADEQTAGKGQHGRSWLAGAGQGVLLSVLLSPPAELCRPVVITAWAAVAVCTTIYGIISRQPRIKWPNDVLLDGRKVCGILIESTAGRLCRAPAFIVGIGLNVKQSAEAFQAHGLAEATSLQQFTTIPLDTHAVAVELVQALDRGLDSLYRGDVAALESRWKDQLELLGKRVTAEGHGATHQGRLIDLSFDAVELASANEERLRLAPERILHLWESME